MFRLPLPVTWFLAILSGAWVLPAQVPNGAWVYPSAAGDLVYQLDERGQRIADYSACGYRGGDEPLPEVAAIIPAARWLNVSPAAGDDTALLQAAINTVSVYTPDASGWRGVVFLAAGEYQLADTIKITVSGVVLKGAGSDPATGTRLRATDPRQYTVIQALGTGSRNVVSGTTRNLVQTLMPAGARTFQVDSTTGLAVGHTVIVKRPSPANWIADLGMDQLGPGTGGDPDVVPWTAGSRDLLFDRVITRIEGKWITVDAPIPQSIESRYGGGQIWRYTWTGRIQQVGIEDLYGFSDHASPTDEAHAWTFIELGKLQHGWVRNITAQYFGFSAVYAGAGCKWVTVAGSRCLDAVSIITGSRRYSFHLDDAELCLFIDNFARKGRHDFVLGSLVAGPNAFVHCTAESAYSDTGPHHRWTVGALFDNVVVGGNELNIQNRGNSGTGHGWVAAYSVVWNSVANAFRVRNPPTARNWLVGSKGAILASAFPVGADPEGTYDGSGPAGRAVYPRSLYHGQLQQRLKRPRSEFREVWLGDIDQHASTGGAGETVACNATWLTRVEALDALPAAALFDTISTRRHTAFSLSFTLDAGDTVVAAALTVGLRAVGSTADAADDTLRLDDTTAPLAYPALGWSPLSPDGSASRTLAVDPALLADGRLNVALGPDSAADYAVLLLQIAKAMPTSRTVELAPAADAFVRAGTAYQTGNFGTAQTLVARDVTVGSSNHEIFLRWDLSGLEGVVLDARVQLAGVTTTQAGNENGAALTGADWVETALTFQNKPVSGKLFAQWLPVAGGAGGFNVTAPLAAARLRDAQLALRVFATGDHGVEGEVSYASRESVDAADRPRLVLTLAGATASIADWRAAYFGTFANAADAADLADPDGDAFTNVQEYVFGTDPLAREAGGLLSLASSAEALTLAFTARAATGQGYAGLARRYAVETSSDLANPGGWSVLPGYADVAGADQSVLLTVTGPAPRQFFRLKSWLQ
jgi:hypothetical protein